MKYTVIAALLLALTGCGRVHDHSDLRRSEIGSFARQIVQTCLVYEYDRGKTDVDQLITLDELISFMPSLFEEKVLACIASREIVFVPQPIPVDPTKVVVIVEAGDQMMTVRADLTTRRYVEENK